MYLPSVEEVFENLTKICNKELKHPENFLVTFMMRLTIPRAISQRPIGAFIAAFNIYKAKGVDFPTWTLDDFFVAMGKIFLKLEAHFQNE